MKKIKNILGKSLLIASVSLGSVSAYAACDGSFTCTGNLDRVYFSGAGDLFLRLAGVDIPSGTNCTRGSNYSIVQSTHPKLKEFYAMSLTAFSLENAISLRVNADAECSVSYMFIDK